MGARFILLGALMVMSVSSGCGGSDEPTSQNGELNGDLFVGSCAATSFAIQGVGDLVVDDGLSIFLTFNMEPRYGFNVHDDVDGLFCKVETPCGYAGDYGFTGNTLTLRCDAPGAGMCSIDGATQSEITFIYSFSGDTLSITGSGLTATFACEIVCDLPCQG